MTYPEALAYLSSFTNYEKVTSYPYTQSFKLARIRGLLSLLGNPHHGLRSIHVAGSKGKGSTCAFLTYILREAGFKVGLYTSPHLSDFRERIRIVARNPLSACRVTGSGADDFEGMIPTRALSRLVAGLKPVIAGYHQRCPYGRLSFFEVYTAIAFLYFMQEQVDFAVLETGLGGRLDATNVVHPLVCVLTPISYEHTDKLGNTLTKIAREKAGIIKESGIPVVSVPQPQEAMRVIRQRCRSIGAPLCVATRDVLPRSSLRLLLRGQHQLTNAALAVAAVRALEKTGIRIPAKTVSRGLAQTCWPARCEVISQRPTVVLDGAQNAASAQVLARAITRGFRYRKLILVLGVSQDKDVYGISKALGAIADCAIFTCADTPRALHPAVLATYFPGTPSYVTTSVRQAYQLAHSRAGRTDLILITGSLFVAGEARLLAAKKHEKR